VQTAPDRPQRINLAYRMLGIGTNSKMPQALSEDDAQTLAQYSIEKLSVVVCDFYANALE